MTTTAKDRLLQFLPNMRYAMQCAEEKAQEGDSVAFAGIIMNPDGGGKMIVHFAAKDFIADLAEVLGEDPATIEAGIMNAKALGIVQRFSRG